MLLLDELDHVVLKMLRLPILKLQPSYAAFFRSAFQELVTEFYVVAFTMLAREFHYALFIDDPLS